MRRTIGFINMPTTRTLARCVAWVNRLNGNARQPAFVLDKAFQLVERPAMQIVSLLLPKPYPFTDALQIFKDNAASGALSKGNDFFTDLVVNVCGEPTFTPGQVTQNTGGGLGLFGLQPTPLATAAQTLPQLPQLAGSRFVETSQPSP